MRDALSVAWYRCRATLSRRAPGYLGVVVLIALVGGLGAGAMIGARRTQSAFPAYLRSSNQSDLQLNLQTLGSGANELSASLNANLYHPALIRTFARLPGVRKVAAAPGILVGPLNAKGQLVLAAPLQDNTVQTIGSVGGEFVDQDRLVADQGRQFDPRRIGEFVADSTAARLLGWHLGQTFTMGAYSFAALAQSNGAQPSTPPALRFRARLVGIVAIPNDVAHDAVDQYPVDLVFTPALTARAIADGAAGFTTYSFVLDHGAAQVPAVEREIAGAVPTGSSYTFHVTSVVEAATELALRPESIALGAFGFIAALAALFIGAQALARGVRLGGADLPVLRALGAPPGVVLTDTLLAPLAAVALGALLAAMVGVLLSPIAPIGAVHQVTPAPGFDLDWTVIGAVVALYVVGLGTIVTLTARRMVRGRLGDNALRRPSAIVGAAVRLGLPAPAIAGIRFAFDRSAGRDSAPGGAALLGTVLAVAVTVTTLTFGSGLGALVRNPSLYGWNWSYALEQAAGGNVPPYTEQQLSRDHDVAAYSGFDFADAQIDGVTVPILLTTAHASISPPIVSGDRLGANDQIVLGGATLAQLHKKVGETVTASYGSPRDYPVYVPPTTLRIVGVATLPAIGTSGALHTSMGTGAIVPIGIVPAVMTKALHNSDPNLNGPSIIAVRLRAGVPVGAGLASLRRIASATNRVLDADPQEGGGSLGVVAVEQPAEIVNYRTLGSTPAILAAGLALGAVVSLGLTLIASVRRRRRDLALLKTLGLVRRQLAMVVSAQATAAALVGLVVGIPLGIAVGGWLWTLFAREIYAVPLSSVPGLQILLVVLGALVFTNLVALVPGQMAARTQTAPLLRVD